MRRFLSIAIVSVGALLIVAGCSKFTLDARNLDEAVTMTANLGAEDPAEQRGHFQRSEKAAYLGLAFNLVTLTEPDVPTILLEEMNTAGGNAIRNLTVHKEVTFLDGFISFVTLGIYNQETITLEGDVVSTE